MSEIEVEVRIVTEEDPEKLRVPSGSEIIDLLRDLDQNPETVVVKRNDKIVPEEEELEDGDELLIVPVVSGG